MEQTKKTDTPAASDSKLGYTGSDSPVCVLPETVTAATINEQNRRYWQQPVGPKADQK